MMNRHLKAVNWQSLNCSESKEEKATGSFLVSNCRQISFSINFLANFEREVVGEELGDVLDQFLPDLVDPGVVGQVDGFHDVVV